MAGGCNAHGVSGSAGIGHHVVESMFEKDPSPYVRSLSPDRYRAPQPFFRPHSRGGVLTNRTLAHSHCAQVYRWVVELGQGGEAGAPHLRDLLPHPQGLRPRQPQLATHHTINQFLLITYMNGSSLFESSKRKKRSLLHVRKRLQSLSPSLYKLLPSQSEFSCMSMATADILATENREK
jgi:hypothetical protein